MRLLRYSEYIPNLKFASTVDRAKLVLETWDQVVAKVIYFQKLSPGLDVSHYHEVVLVRIGNEESPIHGYSGYSHALVSAKVASAQA